MFVSPIQRIPWPWAPTPPQHATPAYLVSTRQVRALGFANRLVRDVVDDAPDPLGVVLVVRPWRKILAYNGGERERAPFNPLMNPLSGC